MAKHRRLKPIREYLYDKGEMIEQLFSSMPIVEVRNMVPIKLQGMPLHELKAECLVELLEMSDREILSIMEGKKTRDRDPSSSESEDGGVVVISDDEKRIKKEKKSIRRPAARRDSSDGSSTEQSISSKKKNKRKCKEEDDPKGKKKKKDSRQPVPSSSKDVQPSKEIPKKKNRSKPSEKSKPPTEEVVVVDDVSSEESGNRAGKNTGEKSLLDLLELEMRARAIRSLLKQEEETQAKKILSEYKDEPDDLIPVEVPPPQVDLLSDSDEELKNEDAAVQPSIRADLQTDVDAGSLSSKAFDVSHTLLGTAKNKGGSEVTEMIEVDEASTDSVKVNPTDNDDSRRKHESSMSSSFVNNSIPEPEKSRSDSTLPNEIDSIHMKYGDPGCLVNIKVEKESSGESNEQRKLDHPVVKVPPSSAEPLSLTITKLSNNSSNFRITPMSSACGLKEIAEIKSSSSKEPATFTKIDQTDICVPDVCSGDYISCVVKIEPELDEISIGANKLNSQENEENICTPPKVLPVECSKKLSVSTGDEYHSNFDEDILDYDYNPSLNNSERQSPYSEATGTSCPQSSLLCGPLTIKSEKVEDDCIKEQSEIDEQLDKSQTYEMVRNRFSSIDKFVEPNSSLIANSLNASDDKEPALMDGQLRPQAGGTGIETRTVVHHLGEVSLKAQSNISCDKQDSPSIIPYANEEVLLDISDDEDDCIQPAEHETSSASDQSTSDNIADSLEKPHNHFLVNNALGSLEAISPKSTIQSQEPNATNSSKDSHQDKTKEGVDATNSNQDHHDTHSRNEDQIMLPDREPVGLSDVKLLIDRQTLHATSVEDITDCSLEESNVTLVSENEQSSANQHKLYCNADSLEKQHNHFLVNNALGSLEAISPIKSQEHSETDSTIDRHQEKTDDGVDVTDSDQHHHDMHSRNEEKRMPPNCLPDSKAQTSLEYRQTLNDISVEDIADYSLDESKTTLVTENEQSSANQHTGDRIADSSKVHNSFLVNDDDGSPEATSPRSTVKSQEHNEADSSMSSYKNQIDGEAVPHSGQVHQEKSASKEERGTLSDAEPLNYTDVHSLARNPHDTSVGGALNSFGKRVTASVVEMELITPDERLGDEIVALSDEQHNRHFLEIDALGSPDLSSKSPRKSQEHDKTYSSVNIVRFPIEEKDATLISHDHHGMLLNKEERTSSGHESLESSDGNSPKSVVGRLGLRDSSVEEPTKRFSDFVGTEPLEHEKYEFLVDDDPECLGTQSHPSPKPDVVDGSNNPFLKTQEDNEVLTKKVKAERFSAEGLANNNNQHFLVDVALDSLDVEASKTEAVSQEQNDFSRRGVGGDCSIPDSTVTKHNTDAHRESTCRVETSERLYVMDGNSVSVCNDFNLLKSETVIANLKLPYSKTDNELILLRDNGVTVPGQRIMEITSKDMGQRDLSALEASGSTSTVSFTATLVNREIGEHSGIERKSDPSIGSEANAFVGCNSIETQKKIQITDGQAARQPFILDVSSQAALSGKGIAKEQVCDTYSTEYVDISTENEFDKVSGHKEYLGESIDCSLQNNSVENRFSSAWNATQLSSECFKGTSNPKDSCSSSAPFLQTKGSSLGTSHFSLIEEVRTDASESGNKNSEGIEIDYEDLGGLPSEEKQKSDIVEYLNKTTSHLGNHCPMYFESPPTKPMNLEHIKSYLIGEMRTDLSGARNSSCEVIEIHDEVLGDSTSEKQQVSKVAKRLEEMTSSLEDPCPTSFPSSPTKVSTVETVRSTLIEDVKVNDLETGNSCCSKVIKFDDEGSICNRSVEKQGKERLTEKPSHPESSNPSPLTKGSSLDTTQPSLFLGVRTCELQTGTNNSEIIEIVDDDSDCSCSEKKQISTVINSLKERTASLEDSYLLSLPSPPAKAPSLKTMHLSLTEEVKTDESGTKVDEDRLGCTRNVGKQNFLGNECIKETSHPEDPFLLSDSSSTAKASGSSIQVVRTCELENEHKNEINGEDLGGNNLSQDVEQLSRVTKCLKKIASNLEGSSVSSPPTDASNLGPSQSSLIQEVRTCELGIGTNDSEVIEVDDEDSCDSSSGKEQISTVIDCLKEITASLEDPCPSALPSPRTKVSSLETTHLSFIEEIRTNELGTQINSAEVDGDETSSVEKQNFQGTEYLKETSHFEDPLLMSVPSTPTKASSLEPIQSSMDQVVRTGELGTVIIEIDDEDFVGSSRNCAKEQLSRVAECLKKISSSLEDSFFSSFPSPLTTASSLGSTQSSLIRKVSTCELGTGTDCSEVIELDDEDYDGCSTEKEPISMVIDCLKERTVSLEDLCPSALPFPSTKVSSLETSNLSLIKEVKTDELGTQINSTVVYENHTSSVEKQNIKGTEYLKKTSHLDDPLIMSAPSASISPQEAVQSALDRVVRTGALEMEIIEIDDEDFAGSSSEEEQLSKVTEYLKEITSSLEVPCFSSVPSPQTKSSCFEPSCSSLIEEVRTNALGTENNNSEIIELDDEDWDASDCEKTSKETDCSKIITSHFGDPLLLSIPSFTSKASSLESPQNSIKSSRTDILGKRSNNSEVIEIDDEDSDDSSSDCEEGSGDSSENTTQNDEESSLTVHSISDDDDPVGTQLNKGVLGSFDKEEIRLECITDENNGLQKGEGTIALETKSDDIIDISDSGGEDNASTDSSVKRTIGGSQIVDVKVVDDMPSKTNTEIQISSRNKDFIGLQRVNVHNSGSKEDESNNSVAQPCEEPVPIVNKRLLEEGEIEESDSVVEISESEGRQYSKALGHLGTSSVTRIRSLKQNHVTDTESDSSADSFHRKRSRKRVKLRKKRRRVISKSREVRSTERKSGKIKYQEKHLPIESPSVPFIAEEGKADVNTIVIEDDDEKIVQAITEQMPPEILELDDSDETKTNWTARWLESSHVKKVVTTSKILTNARKKLKLKLKVKDVPVIEARPPLVAEVPQLIGSVEEYHRLVKEGVITSSKPDATKKSVAGTGLIKGSAAENSEATPNIDVALVSLVDKKDDDCLRRVKSSEKVHVKSLEIERVYKPVVAAIDEHGAQSVAHRQKLEEGEIEENGDGVYTSAPSVVGARDDLMVKDSMPSSERNNSIVSSVQQEAGMDDGKYTYGLASNSACEPPVSEINILENERVKSSKPVGFDDSTDRLSGCIRSFYEMMKPGQVIGIASSLKSLSDIPYPPSVWERVEPKYSSLVSVPPSLSPSPACPGTTATESNDVHVSNQIISSISPSPNICDTTENNPTGSLESLASSLKSLSDIPFPTSVLERVEPKCSKCSVSVPSSLSPSAACPATTATESNDVHVSNQIISSIFPSPNVCDTTENNPIGSLESRNVDVPQLFLDKDLEEGEIEDSDCEPENSICTTTAVENHSAMSMPIYNVANTHSPAVLLPTPVQSATGVNNIWVKMPSLKIPAQPVAPASSSVECTSNRLNPVVPGSNVDLHNHSTPRQCVQPTVAGNSMIRSLPFLPNSSSQIIGHASAIAQCDNTAISSSVVHPTHGVSTISHSTLSSVISPSYSISEGQAIPFMVNSALQSAAVAGVQMAFPPINPIQAATAEISNLHQYGTPPSGMVQPQMSVNVNSTLNMYDQYYSWMYRQGLSGSMNSSYGYGTPDPSQDASTIYKQWGEYYKKLMEACEDSAVRASVSNMFGPVPPNLADSKGYSWVYERPNQTPAFVNNPETSAVIPKEVEPVQIQAPSGEWNYRYGLKGILNEHFVTPGTAPAPTVTSNPPRGGPLRRRPSSRGRRKKKR